GLDPAVSAKRIVVSEVVVYDQKRPLFVFSGEPELALGVPRASHALAKKLSRGGIEIEIDRMKDLARDAEYNLLEDVARRPDEYPQLLRQLEQYVLGECSEAHLRA